MATIEVRDVAGGAVGEHQLPEELFAAPVNVPPRLGATSAAVA
jgi:hypothetical protein